MASSSTSDSSHTDGHNGGPDLRPKNSRLNWIDHVLSIGIGITYLAMNLTVLHDFLADMYSYNHVIFGMLGFSAMSLVVGILLSHTFQSFLSTANGLTLGSVFMLFYYMIECANRFQLFKRLYVFGGVLTFLVSLAIGRQLCSSDKCVAKKKDD